MHTQSFTRCFVLVALAVGISSTVFAGMNKDEKHLLRGIEETYESEMPDALFDAVAIDEVLDYALRNNARVKAAFYQWQASAEGIYSKRALSDPEISFKTFVQEVETRVGPQKQMYGINQKIPFVGKLFTQGQMATDVARQKYQEYYKEKLTLAYEVKQAFFEYWYLYKSIKVTEENESLLRNLEEVVQSKFKSGLVKNQDLLKVQVELGTLANESIRLAEYQKPLVARLNALLNRDTNAAIGWPQDIDVRMLTINEEELFSVLHDNNPDLKRAHQRIKEAEKRVRLAKLEFLPDVSVGVDYTTVDNGPLNVADNGTDAVAVNLKMNVPWLYGKQKSALDQARAEHSAVQSEEEQVVRDIESKFAMVLFALRDSERQIKLYRDALLPKAEQSLKANETSYKGGNTDFLSLIDSQRQLINFQLSYYRAIRDYEQSLAELEVVVGGDIS